ncbi:hypothetical protein AMS68_006021 [Peltaster fructicola]|uniref:Calcineurin-like phosphoesterase domain-containing protein n=1 Tax=Peltaster fructicola TaxID=286661 RepID=A0A6H0Y0H2_9PEZI|nr:hypothetical protein AMS68_006021 [Peltaster fructicola]
MSTDKKKDDDTQSPADWVARHSRLVARGSNLAAPARLQHADDSQMRKRAEREMLIANQQSRIPAGSRSQRLYNHKSVPHYDEGDPIARMCDPDEEGSCANVTVRMVQSRRWRRLLIILLLLFGGFCYYWVTVLWPILDYDYALKVGFLKHPRGTIGLAMGGDYEFAKEKIAQLDNSLLPGGTGDQDGQRRLVFVGDIHGCKDELLRLMQEINFDVKQDHLIATGDVISKGPNSPGVVDELIRMKASSVRGNHEDRLLTLAAVQVDKYGQPQQLSKAAKDANKLLKQLKPRHLEYLRSLPLILRIPPLPLAPKSKKDHIHSEILVVHAGLVPAVPLDKQDPYFVMNMRSLSQTAHVPSAKRPSKDAYLQPWVDSWNWYHTRLSKGQVFRGWHRSQVGLEVDDESSWLDGVLDVFRASNKHQPKPKAQVVIYGHDSREGLVKRQWSIGLDTRCVNGGELTCLVIDAQGRQTYHSVPCNDHTA